jgi:hypothetical protein
MKGSVLDTLRRLIQLSKGALGKTPPYRLRAGLCRLPSIHPLHKHTRPSHGISPTPISTIACSTRAAKTSSLGILSLTIAVSNTSTSQYPSLLPASRVLREPGTQLLTEPLDVRLAGKKHKDATAKEGKEYCGKRRLEKGTSTLVVGYKLPALYWA